MTTRKKTKSSKKVVTKVVVASPPTEQKENPDHRILLDRCKQAITGWLSSDYEEMNALGQIHSLLDVAEKMKIPKQTVVIELSLAEMLATKRKWDKLVKDGFDSEDD